MIKYYYKIYDLLSYSSINLSSLFFNRFDILLFLFNLCPKQYILSFIYIVLIFINLKINKYFKYNGSRKIRKQIKRNER